MSTDIQTKPAAPSADPKAKSSEPSSAPVAPAAVASGTAEQKDATCPASDPAAPPLSKEEQALALVKKYMYGNAAASLVPIPVLDLIAVCGIQLAMARAIAGVYGVPFKQDAAQEVVTTLVTGISTRTFGMTVALSFAKLMPGIGTAVGVVSLPVLTGALTYATGKVFILHFEAGGTVLNLDAKKMRSYFEQTFKEGLEQAKAAAKEQIDAT